MTAILILILGWAVAVLFIVAILIGSGRKD
jgi:hypothetical protein